MKRIAKFEKVSLKQYEKDYFDTFNKNDKIEEIYNIISLPSRATRGSAGYDFKSPITFTLKPQETIKIPTGIRVKIDESWVLNIFPRSSLGFKYRLQLDNTVGIIDSDYYNSSNEGHILIKMTNNSLNKEVTVKANEGFAQGIFLEYGITEDDDCSILRDGGFGSTNR